jgi:hypothetical protein
VDEALKTLEAITGVRDEAGDARHFTRRRAELFATPSSTCPPAATLGGFELHELATRSWAPPCQRREAAGGWTGSSAPSTGPRARPGRGF